MDLSVNVNFDHAEWVKGNMIGSGSFGHVHIAMDKATGHIFVVKSCSIGVGLKSLENEADILMKLKNSPHVIQYLGKQVIHGSSNECLLNLFLEYMGGGSLFDLVDKFGGPLFEGAIRSYTREILLGLNYLHDNGVVHHDIKCKNLLLDSYGNVKIADFGCAQNMDNVLRENKNLNILQHKHCVLGTPLWMAPEVLKGERTYSSADIWSLGCTIIEMATGKPPCWGDIVNPMAVVLKIVTSNEKPYFPKGFSKEGLDFLDICLQRDPKRRPTAKELLHHPFVMNNRDIKVNLTKHRKAPSPSSVLDVSMFDISFSDSDEEIDDTDVDERVPSVKVSTSIERHVQSNGVKDSFIERDTTLETSGDWVTIRSS